MKPLKTWFVIADGGRARIVRKRDAQDGLEHPLTFETQVAFDATDAHSRTRELGDDRPGRSHESAGTVRHALQPREDLHKAAKRDFLHEAAKLLNEAGGRDEFDRVILVAPAPALGQLHEALDAATRSKVSGQLQKDLTNVPDGDLPAHLGSLI
jgi:protein required for attachment to host cells